MANTQGVTAPIVPSRVNFRHYRHSGRVLYEVEGTDEYLTSTGLIKNEHVPGQRFRCHIDPRQKGGIVKCVRIANGNVRAIVHAEVVIDLDKAFKLFLGSLLVDTRLSLVKGERP